MFIKMNYSPFNEGMPKRHECYHIHLHISASRVFKKSSFLENKKQRDFDFRQANQGNYYRNDAKQPIHVLIRLVVATMCKQLPFSYLPCLHPRVTFWHSLVEWTIVHLVQSFNFFQKNPVELLNSVEPRTSQKFSRFEHFKQIL